MLETKKVRGKIRLLSSSELGADIYLKRWSEDEGFYLDWISYKEDKLPEVMCEGYSIEECINNLNEEIYFPLKIRNLFSVEIANKIIDTFDLTYDDITYVEEMGAKSEF